MCNSYVTEIHKDYTKLHKDIKIHIFIINQHLKINFFPKKLEKWRRGEDELNARRITDISITPKLHHSISPLLPLSSIPNHQLLSQLLRESHRILLILSFCYDRHIMDGQYPETQHGGVQLP